MKQYNIIMETNENTVVSQYQPIQRKSHAFQTEADLENELISVLCEQGYQRLSIHKEADLINNLRAQLSKVNNYQFTDNEWDSFFKNVLSNPNESIEEKTRKIQEDHIQVLNCDDGSIRNIYLIDKENINNNQVQVINQYEEDGGNHDTRYDVSILVNGLPLVHIELKRRGRDIRDAFNQIERYQRDSFWASSGLYEFVQIFVISNGTYTKYYSNTTRFQHIKDINGVKKTKKTSNSFEFTSYWADGNNKVIPDLLDFAMTFLTKRTLLNVITKYCVFTTEKLLLVMRPYQIAATERILNRIEIAHNYKKAGIIDAGGYIWHTTGSGKTLTSFKTAQLATKLPFIDKVLFVVDRKDLDYQTMKEYDRFEKGAANSNKSTRVLQKQLEDDNTRIIITTIQKLSTFVAKNKNHPVYQKQLAIIFDECHRSQFGDMHDKITKAFKNYYLFGFTGTPIFAVNAGKGGKAHLKTTEQAFGMKLHTYTIVDAINDGNVLQFKVDYVNTVKEKDIVDREVPAIDIEAAMSDPRRVSEVVSYIIDNFDTKTKRNHYYNLKGKRMSGFNSIFAVASIPMAKRYYEEFKRQLDEKHNPMTIATIFSYVPNEAETEDFVEDENFDTSELDKTSRDFLEHAIEDYNKTFSTNYDTSSDKFENYYKDISQRMKNREIDLLIVVNMFLTGFDATTLNTLWVDKNLKFHGLIQAFSRTNRILNSVKNSGNIICFRNLQKETDEAISLFGNKDAAGIVLLKTYEEYYKGYDENNQHYKGYEEVVAEIMEKFPIGQMIIGDKNKRLFVSLFGLLLKLRNILSSFDQFADDNLISDRELQDYQSTYIDIYHELRPKAVDKEKINDDIIFELELIKQVEINIDYILMLIDEYKDTHDSDREIIAKINRAVDSTIRLRSKKALIELFISSINVDNDGSILDSWKSFIQKQKEEDLNKIILEEKLKPVETKIYIEQSIKDGTLRTTGTSIEKLLPPMGLFGGGGNRVEKKNIVIVKLQEFFDRYFDI